MSTKKHEKRQARSKRPGAGKARPSQHGKGQKRAAHGKDKAGGQPGKKPRRHHEPSGALWLYGRHAVAAALNNPAREVARVVAAKNAVEWLSDNAGPKALQTIITDARPEEIDQLLPEGAVHQGLAAEVKELPLAKLEDVCANPAPDAPVLVLDQVTDPQNIGTIFRAAAAFGARGVIVQDRRTPPLAGALAKAAAGAIETIPCIKVVNIARTLETLAELGYETAGLAGEATAPLQSLDPQKPVALVLGAEGAGLRRLVAERCTQLVRIPIAPTMESLNVATAAAISLYERARVLP
ncbi:MAG: 23S rRNA (guanosine(2251)-2'-O)-methyltransferase RlmB [Pseudomonadota bacterium]